VGNAIIGGVYMNSSGGGLGGPKKSISSLMLRDPNPRPVFFRVLALAGAAAVSSPFILGTVMLLAAPLASGLFAIGGAIAGFCTYKNAERSLITNHIQTQRQHGITANSIHPRKAPPSRFRLAVTKPFKLAGHNLHKAFGRAHDGATSSPASGNSSPKSRQVQTLG